VEAAPLRCDDRRVVSVRVQLALLILGLACGALTLAIAHEDPAVSFAGRSDAAAVTSLAAGWALLAAGLATARRRAQSPTGPLLTGASFAWFVVEWNNPGVASAVVFTVGLALYASAPPLVAHAALAYTARPRVTTVERLALAAAYAGAILVLGVLPAFVFDPEAAGCADCPSNLLLVDSRPALAADLYESGVRAGLVWALALVAVLVVRVVRAPPALRQLAVPVLGCAAVYLALVAADLAHSLSRGMLGSDSTDRTLWFAQAGALVGLAAAVGWSWLRDRRARIAVARLVVDMTQQRAPGGLRDVLARTLGDPSLALAYPVAGGRLVDAGGRPVTVTGEVTHVVRDGQDVALLAHRRGLLDDPALVHEVTSAARLALENERLQAVTRAQLADLRASRARVIAAGDAERQRLERNLHDGAQQHLVGLTLSLRLARSRLRAGADPDAVAEIAGAEQELLLALDELRDLAHGLFPAVLAEEGLARALEFLAEQAPRPVRLGARPGRRLPADVEAAAYFLVARLAERPELRAVVVDVRDEGAMLLVEVRCEGDPGDLVDMEDRLGALDGRVQRVDLDGPTVTIRAEIPCA
jgi:signal transduction histidine kinase